MRNEFIIIRTSCIPQTGIPNSNWNESLLFMSSKNFSIFWGCGSHQWIKITYECLSWCLSCYHQLFCQVLTCYSKENVTKCLPVILKKMSQEKHNFVARHSVPNNFEQLSSNFCVKIATQIENWITICG